MASPATRDRPLFRMFVYGTLKRGGRYHRRFCTNAAAIEAATIWGRLYDLDEGYPTLEIPDDAVLAEASADPVRDAYTEHEFAASGARDLPRPAGPWDCVYGELVAFPDPARDVPPIDRLEDFRPGQPNNLYHRRLALVQTESALVPAWLYTGHRGLIARGRPIASGEWAGR